MSKHWPKFQQFKHHGKKVWGRVDLRGYARLYCLCTYCAHFMPENRDGNCAIANVLFRLCCLTHTVAPVWECPDFAERMEEHNEQAHEV